MFLTGEKTLILNVHATAVCRGPLGILIVGPSRAGKSRLAADLIAATRQDRPIALVGDDRIRVDRRDGRCTISGHRAIAGFIERRGVGIVAEPFVRHAELRGIIMIGACECGLGDALDRLDSGAVSVSQHPRNLCRLLLADAVRPAERLRLALHWLDNFGQPADEQSSGVNASMVRQA